MIKETKEGYDYHVVRFQRNGEQKEVVCPTGTPFYKGWAPGVWEIKCEASEMDTGLIMQLSLRVFYPQLMQECTKLSKYLKKNKLYYSRINIAKQ